MGTPCARHPAHAGLPGGSAGSGLAAAALGWLGGLAVQLQQPALWPAAVHAALLAAGLLVLGSVALAWARRPTGPLPPALVLALGAAALAAGSTGWRAEVRLAERLPAALEGADLRVVGVVAALPQPGPSGTRFVLEVEQAWWQGRPVALPPRLALGWYSGFADERALADPRAELRAGQRWQLPLRLKRPQGTHNPQVHDVELAWFEQGIGAVGYVRVPRSAEDAAGSARLLDEGRWRHPVERARQTLRDAIFRSVADPRAAGVLAALVVGDQAAIEREDWELFRTTATAHVVAISGVHITMLAWLAGAAAAAGWRRSRRLALWHPAGSAGRWVGLAVAAGYALLAGGGVPAQRTVLMLAVVVGLRAAGARWPGPAVLLAAAVVVTAVDPWALLQPGFWLSFAAVGLLLLSGPLPRAPGSAEAGRAEGLAGHDGPDRHDRHDRSEAPGAWLARLAGGHLRAQAVATLGLAPLSLLFFQQLSAVGFVANLLTIPLVTLLVTPLGLVGAVLPAAWALAGALVQALVAVLGWLAAWPGAAWSMPVAPDWAAAAGLLGALLGLLPVPWALRWLALPLVLPLLWPPLPRPAEGRFELLAADVGQGTAVLVRTRGHLLVYDAGPQYARDSDAGRRVLLPLLRARGERRIDRLVVSHRDSDHAGGAAGLLAGLPVGELFSSLDAAHPLRAGGLPHTRCNAGQRWHWDGVDFELLHPAAADHGVALRPNALSCVLRVRDALGRSALLTGDIEAAQEAALVQRHGAALASTVLLVPHHGSRTSSTPAFVAAVQPAVAVVQAGYRSRFGHPAPDVVARYAAQGVAVVRSDRCGAWQWFDGRATCSRAQWRRYWQAVAAPDEAGAPG